MSGRDEGDDREPVVDPGPDPHGDIAHELSRMARRLQAEEDTDAMVEELVASAVALIPGAGDGSISVVLARRDVTSQGATSDLPRRIDRLQAETREGPCLDAVFQEQTVRVPDMRAEGRWPKFARRAVEEGAHSMLSFQLYVEGDNLGALNLYGHHPGAFDEESEHVGLIFASHAAIAFADARKHDQVLRGMDARDVIGQAKGILMERYDLSADKAFSVLARLSQNLNRKLRDVAAEVATTRKLPDAP